MAGGGAFDDKGGHTCQGGHAWQGVCIARGL